MFYSYQTKLSEENLRPSADREGTDNGDIVVLSTCQINTCLEPNNIILQGFGQVSFNFSRLIQVSIMPWFTSNTMQLNTWGPMC